MQEQYKLTAYEVALALGADVAKKLAAEGRPVTSNMQVQFTQNRDGGIEAMVSFER